MIVQRRVGKPVHLFKALLSRIRRISDAVPAAARHGSPEVERRTGIAGSPMVTGFNAIGTIAAPVAKAAVKALPPTRPTYESINAVIMIGRVSWSWNQG
jgi:hypothetical protein